MKKIVLYIVSALAMFAQARDTNRYDRVEVREGFEFSQRGGLGTSNEVVTAVSLPVVASNLAEGASFGPFSNAVAKVVTSIVYSGETDPHVASWARKTGGTDPQSPVFSELDPAVSSWARKVDGQDAPQPVTDISGKQDRIPYPTNDIPRDAVRGNFLSPRRIGPYLWEISSEGEDFVAATNLYAKKYPTVSSGGCAGIADVRYHGRNFDWYYDRKATVVVRIPARDGMNGLIGVSSGAIDDADLESGINTNALVTLPFSIVDGMNDKGIVAQVNVIPKKLPENHAWHTRISGIPVFMIIRYALERGSTVVEVSSLIRNNVYVPKDFPFDFHFLVSGTDGVSSRITEDGYSSNISSGKPKVMTNFRLRGTSNNSDGTISRQSVVNTDNYGMGLERYDLLATNSSDVSVLSGMTDAMKDAWYSKAYDKNTSPYWWTEHCVVNDLNRNVYAFWTDALTQDVLTERDTWDSLYASEHDPSLSTYRGGRTWITVHTTVYDKTDLVMYLIHQEGAKTLRFPLQIGSPDTSYDVDSVRSSVDSAIGSFAETGSVRRIVSGTHSLSGDLVHTSVTPDTFVTVDSYKFFEEYYMGDGEWYYAFPKTVSDIGKTAEGAFHDDEDPSLREVVSMCMDFRTDGVYVSETNRWYRNFDEYIEEECISEPEKANYIGFGMYTTEWNSPVTQEDIDSYGGREELLRAYTGTFGGIAFIVVTNGAEIVISGHSVTNFVSVETPNDVFYDGTNLMTRGGTGISVSGNWIPASTNVSSETLRFGLGKIGRTVLWKADATYVCETNVCVKSVTTNEVTVIDGTNYVVHPPVVSVDVVTNYAMNLREMNEPNVTTNSTTVVVPGWTETNYVTHVETNVVIVLGTNIVDRTLGGVDSMVDGRGVISLGDDGRMTARSEAAMYDEAATNRGSAVSAAFARAVAANVGDDVLNSSDVNLTKTLGSGMLVGEFRVKNIRYELRIPNDLVHLITPGKEKDLVARENGRTYLFGSSSVSGSQDYIRLGNGAFVWLRSLDDVWVGGSNSSTNSRGQTTSVVHGALRMSTHLVHLVDSLIADTPRVIHAAQTNDQWFVDMKASALNSVQHGSDGFVAVSNAAMRSLSNYPDRIYDTSIRWDTDEWSSTGYVHTVLSDGKMEVKAYGWDPVPETVYYTSNRVGSASTEYPEFLLYRGSPSGKKISGSYGYYYYYSVSNLVYRHVLGTSEYEYDDEETKRTATCLSEGFWNGTGTWYQKLSWNGTPTVDPVVTSYLFSVTSARFPNAPRVRISDLKFYNASMGRLDYSSWGQTYVLNGQWGPLHVPKHSGTEAELLAAANSGGHVTVGSVEYGYPNFTSSPLSSFGYYFDKSIGGGSGDHMGSSWEVHTNYHEYVASLRSVTTNSFVTVPSSAVPQSWSSYSVDSAVLNGKVILMLKEEN